MPDATITSTASTFGTITGTFLADQSTITGTVTGVVVGTLDGSVGVPGIGVPDGGTTGQVLAKASGTNYDTAWTTISLAGYATESWVTAGFYPLASNPAGYLTSASIAGLAPINSPAFTGNPTAPTAALADNDTSIATTAFVQQELASGVAIAKNLEVYVRNQTGATLTAGTIVYINGATGNRPTVTKAQANNDANSAQTFGFVKTSIANNGFGYVIVRGECENLDTQGLTEGAQLYLSPTTAGTWTTTKPSAPQHLVYVGIVVRAHPTQGVILVAIQNGYELDEIHDVAIASKADNDLLAYDAASTLWKNKTYSALGLLTSASAASTYYLQTNPAGYITSSALSPYLTSATAASTYAPLASPALTGTPTAPTATAGTNTTQVATTAFVTAAVPAFAATADINSPSSTTKVMSPSNVVDMIVSPNYQFLTLAVGVSGTGGGGYYNSNGGRYKDYQTVVGVSSYGQWCFDTSVSSQGFVGASRGLNLNNRDWSKRIVMSGRSMLGSWSGTSTTDGDANGFCRVSLGGRNALGGGNMSATLRGIGWVLAGGGAAPLQLQVCNGSTVTTVNSSFTPTPRVLFDWKIISDGAGNVTLYVNDSSVATTSAGPTGQQTYGLYSEGCDGTASATKVITMHHLGTKIYYGQ